MRRNVRSAFETYAKYNKKITQEILETVQAIDNPSRLADTVAAYMPLNLEVKQKLLETLDPTQRLELIYGYISSEIEIIKTEERIKGRVKKQMEKTQREYYLNEQMRAIQKEMGEKDDFKSELEELEKRIKRKRMSAGSDHQGQGRVQEAQADVAHERRSHGGSQLHRLVIVAALVRKNQGQDRYRQGPDHSG